MSDKLEVLRVNTTLDKKNHAVELLDIYTQFRKIKMINYTSPLNRIITTKTQKLLRLKEQNISSINKAKVVDEHNINKISFNQQEPPARANHARIIRLKWDPDEENQHEEEETSKEKSVQPIMKASGRDRRRLWT